MIDLVGPIGRLAVVAGAFDGEAPGALATGPDVEAGAGVNEALATLATV
jgi:hypothetical protein